MVRIAYKRELTYGTTPAAVKALLVVQDITYTALKGGAAGNSITIQYTTGGTAGSETVTVTANAIVVNIQSGVSTATQVLAKINASAAALLLVTAAITGTGATAQVTAASTPLATGSGDFLTARFVSEQYSGTPGTTSSAQIRTDRLSSGQVVTDLKVEGGHNFELAKETALEDYMESAMFSAWDTSGSVQTRALTIATGAGTLTAVAGSFITDGIAVGDFLTLGGFTASGNNDVVMVTAVTSALILGIVGPTSLVDGTGVTTTYKRADKLAIGTTKKSLTVEKTFLDLTNHAIIYRGMVASSMDLDVKYGALVTGSFALSGNGYATAAAASEFVSYHEYITAPATTSTLNGSVDMPFLATNISGSYVAGGLSIQSLKISLANNLTTQASIGRIAPEDYSPGTAQIKFDMSSYLKDANWTFLANKLSQTPFALGFQVADASGGYAFYLPAVQVSFSDPASGGQNQIISMAMSGQAKVGAANESAMTIYRF